jgi:hypothetical protein
MANSPIFLTATFLTLASAAHASSFYKYQQTVPINGSKNCDAEAVISDFETGHIQRFNNLSDLQKLADAVEADAGMASTNRAISLRAIQEAMQGLKNFTNGTCLSV